MEIDKWKRVDGVKVAVPGLRTDATGLIFIDAAIKSK
jgi:hypothetical protein